MLSGGWEVSHGYPVINDAFCYDHGHLDPLVFLLVKTLNLLMLGDGYARNLGLNIKRARVLVITCSGVLTAIVTAYCGPIIF